MTGALKIIDGTAASPGIRFASNIQVGLFKTPNGIGVAVGGVKVAEFTASGVAGLGVGTLIPVLDDTLPDGCVWADGRNVSRTTYASLFAKWSTRFGAGDGSTTFGVVDMRGRGLMGRDNIGGADAGRLIGVPVTYGGRLITGSALGQSLVGLLLTHMPSHAHPGGTTDLQGQHIHGYQQNPNASNFGGGPSLSGGTQTNGTTDPAGIHGHNVFLPAQGDGAPHNNVQSSIACN